MDICKQSERISDIRKWAEENPQTEHLSAGLFSFGSGTAAALEAIANRDSKINAMVSLGGRPDLAFDALKRIDIPLLFICGDMDNANVVQHEKSLPYFNTSSKMEVLNDAGKGFTTPSAINEVIKLSREWFIQHL
jgi:putative phosphoribosyl transferase